MYSVPKFNRIKEVLQSQGRKRTWLAGRLGKSNVVVTNYCNNKSQSSSAILREIKEVLDLGVRELSEQTKILGGFACRL